MSDQRHRARQQPDRFAVAAEALAAAERGLGQRGREAESPSPGSPQRHETSDPHDVARAIVLRQLSMGPRSRRQLQDKLRERGCPEDVTTGVLDRMVEVGLVDDEAFAEMLVRSKQVGRGLAKRALAEELRIKGVADDIVAQALEAVGPESERARAEELAAKKIRCLGGLDPQVQARRLAGMLARKGYPPSVIYPVVRDAVDAAPEHQRD